MGRIISVMVQGAIYDQASTIEELQPMSLTPGLFKKRQSTQDLDMPRLSQLSQMPAENLLSHSKVTSADSLADVNIT